MGTSQRIGVIETPSVVPLDASWAALLDQEWLDELDRTPFLARCREGRVSPEELRTFIVQQYLYSRHFTRFLCALLSNIGNESDRMELTENLLEEIGFDEDAGIPHSQIYRQMMERMEIDVQGATLLPSTKQLIETMYDCCRNQNSMVGLAALCLGAEAIVPHVYSQIVRGFASVGEPLENLDFFHIHIAGDDAHAVTMKKIIDRELKRDAFQAPLMKMTALRALQARARFFEGIGSRGQHELVV